MTKTQGERITAIETGFELLVKPMKRDVADIKKDVGIISAQVLVFLKHINNNNGDRNKRKYDKKKYKIIIWASIIGASATILFIIGKLGSMLITFGQILEQLPK